MNVLVTGAGGQLGGALARLAPPWAEINPIDVEDCDFTDIPMLRARLTVEAPDLIINAAAYTDAKAAEREEDLVRAVNVDAVRAMVEAMADTGGKLVQVSCDSVFDGMGARAYQPEDLRRPLSVYGRTKAEGEDCVRTCDLLVRTSGLYEAGGVNFVRTAIDLMRSGAQLRFDAIKEGSPTWASGLARTIWRLVEQRSTGVFHYCDAGRVSLYDFVNAVACEAHAVGLLDRMPTILKGITMQNSLAMPPFLFTSLDCSATHAALGDEAMPWRTNLRYMLEQEVTLK